MSPETVAAAFDLPVGLIAPEGYCPSHHEIHSCPACHDQGFGLVGGDLRPCPECSGRTPPDPVLELARLRVDARYRTVRIGTWEPATGAPRIAAEAWIESWPPPFYSLLFAGGPGNGKTHLAIGLLFAALERHGKRGQFWPVGKLLGRYRATFNEETAVETADAIDQQLARLDLLVLDDLGTEKPTDWTEDRLYEVVSDRYLREAPLVVTTNQPLDRIAPRILSRLKDGRIVVFNGKDRRGTR